MFYTLYNLYIRTLPIFHIKLRKCYSYTYKLNFNVYLLWYYIWTCSHALYQVVFNNFIFWKILQEDCFFSCKNLKNNKKRHIFIYRLHHSLYSICFWVPFLEEINVIQYSLLGAFFWMKTMLYSIRFWAPFFGGKQRYTIFAFGRLFWRKTTLYSIQFWALFFGRK